MIPGRALAHTLLRAPWRMWGLPPAMGRLHARLHQLPVAATVEAVYGSIVHETLRRLGSLRMEGAPVTPTSMAEVHDATWAEARFPDPRRLPSPPAPPPGRC